MPGTGVWCWAALVQRGRRTARGGCKNATTYNVVTYNVMVYDVTMAGHEAGAVDRERWGCNTVTAYNMTMASRDSAGAVNREGWGWHKVTTCDVTTVGHKAGAVNRDRGMGGMGWGFEFCDRGKNAVFEGGVDRRIRPKAKTEMHIPRSDEGSC
jgi:hypothetical protein